MNRSGDDGQTWNPDGHVMTTGLLRSPDLAERPAHALVQALYRRIDMEAAESRFLKTDPCGQEAYSPFGLALLVAEIVTEHTADLVRERDEARAELAAANDAVLELMHQRDAALAHRDIKNGW